MNGIHDMGGMQDMGPITYEKNEPVFHAPWQSRVLAMFLAAGAWRKWNLDAFRHTREVLDPVDYLRVSYYEQWFSGLCDLLVRRGVLTAAELESGVPASGSTKATPPLTPEKIPAGLAAVDPTTPQSWNRYAYVLNSPLAFTDPLGLDCVYYNDLTGQYYVQPGDGDCSDTDGYTGYYFEGTVSGPFAFANGDVYATVDGNTVCSGDCGGAGYNSIDVTATPLDVSSPSPTWAAVSTFFTDFVSPTFYKQAFTTPGSCGALALASFKQPYAAAINTASNVKSAAPFVQAAANSMSSIAVDISALQRAKALAPDLGPIAVTATGVAGVAAQNLASYAPAVVSKIPVATAIAIDASLAYAVGKEGYMAVTGGCHP